MSTKYKSSKEVPLETLTNRLMYLSKVIRGVFGDRKNRIEDEFTMRIPAECDRDADLVLSEASRRLIKLEQQLAECRTENKRLNNALSIAKDYMRESFMEGNRILLYQLHDNKLALSNYQDKS